MNKIIISTLAGLLAGSSLSAYSYEHAEYSEPFANYSGASGAGDNFETRARVIHAEPVYETVTINRPLTECWIEQRAAYGARPGHRVAAGVIGGILGGVAGHQVGRGRGSRPGGGVSRPGKNSTSGGAAGIATQLRDPVLTALLSVVHSARSILSRTARASCNLACTPRLLLRPGAGDLQVSQCPISMALA